MTDHISMRVLVAAVAVMAAVTTGTGVLAQEDDDDYEGMMQFRPFWGQQYGGWGMMAQPIDTDGDGFVTASEASAHASVVFALLDGDGDDMISEDEFADGGRGSMPMFHHNVKRFYVNRTARFKALDGDGDGTVTLAEFMAKAQASHESADTDKDGKVTVWEFRAQQKPF